MSYLDVNGLLYFWQKCRAKFALIGHLHAAATASAAGFMSAADKQKLDGMSAGGGTGGGTGAIPTFTYTGNHQLIDDGGGNWRIKFLTSGVLRFLSDPGATCQLFLVGGGGGGSFGGGGGGYTGTFSVAPAVGVDYQIVIGAGGANGNGTSINGGTGGDTSAFGVSVAGGDGGKGSNDDCIGGNGGSGGGAGSGNSNGGVGGTDGGDGSNAVGYGGAAGSGANKTGGLGQHTTTREFGESTGDLYSDGGAGYRATGAGTAGEPNTGDGGGGAANATAGNTGGSGIAIIRNTRAVSA